MSSRPHIARRGFADGVSWLTAGGNLMARGGGALVPVAVVLLLISLVQFVPLVGVPVLAVISPVMTAGMLNVFAAIERGAVPAPGQVVAGFTSPPARSALLVLGVVFVLGMAAALTPLVMWFYGAVDPEALERLLADPEALENDPERVAALLSDMFGDGASFGALFGALCVALVVATLVLAGLYFAVPLVFFWHWPVIAAVLFSLRAVVVNWLAFLGFGLALIGVLLLAFMVLGMVSGIVQLALGPAGVILAQLLVLALSLFVQLLLAAAQWRAFIGVFPAGDSAGPDDSAAQA